jgi:hypothetical protein
LEFTMPSWVAPMVAAELWKVRWECVAAGISDGSIPTFNHCGMGFVDAACTASQRAAHRARRRLEHPRETPEPELALESFEVAKTTAAVEKTSTQMARSAPTTNAIAAEPASPTASAPSDIAASGAPATVNTAPLNALSVGAASDSASPVTPSPFSGAPGGRACISAITTDEDESGPPPLEEDRGPDIRQWRTMRRNVSRTRIPPRRVIPTEITHPKSGGFPQSDAAPSTIIIPPPTESGLSFPFM